VRLFLAGLPGLQALPSATMETNDFSAGMRRTEVRAVLHLCVMLLCVPPPQQLLQPLPPPQPPLLLLQLHMLTLRPA
jgi:hypothetical protein